MMTEEIERQPTKDVTSVTERVTSQEIAEAERDPDLVTDMIEETTEEMTDVILIDLEGAGHQEEIETTGEEEADLQETEMTADLIGTDTEAVVEIETTVIAITIEETDADTQDQETETNLLKVSKNLERDTTVLKEDPDPNRIRMLLPAIEMLEATTDNRMTLNLVSISTLQDLTLDILQEELLNPDLDNSQLLDLNIPDTLESNLLNNINRRVRIQRFKNRCITKDQTNNQPNDIGSFVI